MVLLLLQEKIEGLITEKEIAEGKITELEKVLSGKVKNLEDMSVLYGGCQANYEDLKVKFFKVLFLECFFLNFFIEISFTDNV